MGSHKTSLEKSNIKNKKVNPTQISTKAPEKTIENEYVVFVSINGFGEIGRNITKKIILKGGSISVINDPHLTITQAKILLENDEELKRLNFSININKK